MPKSFLEKYNEVNNRFKKVLVFKVGADSGFYSEFVNMVFAMLYCLDKKIKFTLFSDNANFADTKGFEEFFLPFVEENHDEFHKKYNNRSRNKDYDQAVNDYKKKHGISFFTYDVFHLFYNNANFAKKKFHMDEPGIRGDSFEAARPLAEMAYRFNDETQKLIDQKIKELALPKDYMAIHIRGGDKVTEVYFYKQKMLEIDAYIEKIDELNRNIRNIFVFTDDYGKVKSLKEKRPEWNIYTLCGENEKGFVFRDFDSVPWEVKKHGLINMFASVEICRKAGLFIGTYMANPDWFLNLVIPKDRLFFADCDKIEWQVLRDKKRVLSKYGYATPKMKFIDRVKSRLSGIFQGLLKKSDTRSGRK